MDTNRTPDIAGSGPPTKALLFFCSALIAAAMLPHHDEGRLVRGLGCALVTEREASLALHADVMLEPSDGHTCRFVSTELSGENLALVVMDRAAVAPLSAGTRPRAVPLPGVGDRALLCGDRLLVHRGKRDATLVLEDERDAPALRVQTERALGSLVAMRLAGEN